jgi:NADPH:quinone reductase
VHVLGFQFRDFATHAPEECGRNDAELEAMLAAGTIVPHVGATFAIDDVVAALRHVGDGRAIGKVILDLTPA